MGNKRLTINLISNIISYSSTILISFVLTPYLVKTLGTEAYSFYPLANNFVNFMGIVTIALNSMANRYITIEIVKQDYNTANKYFSSVFFANIIMSIVFLVPVVIGIPFLDKFLNIPLNIDGSVKFLFLFTFLSMIVSVVTSVFGIATFAKNRIDLRSLRELIIALLRILLFIALFSLFKPSLVFVGLIALILSLTTFIIQYFFTKNLLPEISISLKHFSSKYVKILLSSGIWNSVNQLGNLLLVSGSLFIANIYYGSLITGQYSIVQTVPNFINGMISMLTGIFIPVITYKYAQNDKIGLINELKKSQSIISLFSSSVIAVFIGLSYSFFSLWVPGEDALFLQKISLITIIPHFIIGTVWPLSNLNTVMNKVKIPSFFILFSGVLNIVINLILHFFYQPDFIMVPIVSMCIQLIWVGIFIPLYASRILKINKLAFYSILLKTSISSIIIVIITKTIEKNIIVNSWSTFFITGIFCGIIALTINFFVIFNFKYIIKNVLKKMSF